MARLDRSDPLEEPFYAMGMYHWTHPPKDLEPVVQVMLHNNAKRRERAVDLLHTWVGDGRVPPGELATALAALLAGAQKGYKRLMTVLASYSAAEPLGALLCVLSVEQALADLSGSSPSAQSQLLALYEASLRDADRGLSPEARTRLEALLAKKKTGAVAKRVKGLLELDTASEPIGLRIIDTLIEARLAG